MPIRRERVVPVVIRLPDLELPFPQVGFDLLKAELYAPAVHLGVLRPGDDIVGPAQQGDAERGAYTEQVEVSGGWLPNVIKLEVGPQCGSVLNAT